MKTTSLIITFLVTLAAPTFAQTSSTMIAVGQFNETAETTLDVIDMYTVTEGEIVPTDGDTALARAIELVGDDNGLGHASVFPSDPTFGSDVFSRLSSE